MNKVLFIIGSLRKNSFNRQLAKKAEEILADRVEVKYLHYDTLPLINQDKEYPAHEEVARVRQEVADADALWIFTPEYNKSYPGHLKTLFDWLSRPVKPADFETPTCIRGKVVAISGAGGKAATSFCREKLTELLEFIGATVLSVQTGVAVPPQSWASDELVLSDTDINNLRTEADELVKSL